MVEPVVHVVDETFVVAAPSVVRERVCRAEWWQGWLPGVVLSAAEDRGRLGIRWQVRGVLAGTAETWLEPMLDGVLVHTYLRAGLGHGELASRRSLERRFELPLKAAMRSTKDDLERGRRLGEPREPAPQRVVSATGTRRVTRRPAPLSTERPEQRRGDA